MHFFWHFYYFFYGIFFCLFIYIFILPPLLLIIIIIYLLIYYHYYYIFWRSIRILSARVYLGVKFSGVVNDVEVGVADPGLGGAVVQMARQGQVLTARGVVLPGGRGRDSQP